MTVKIGDDIIKELDIFAKGDVQKKQILDYYKDFIINMKIFMMSGLYILE